MKLSGTHGLSSTAMEFELDNIKGKTTAYRGGRRWDLLAKIAEVTMEKEVRTVTREIPGKPLPDAKS